MAKLYYNRIIMGLMTLDEVPTKWRTEVEKLISE